MISTELYEGQGLGNQLWCYATTRVIALDKGFTFGIEHPERFKGKDFLNLDFGEPINHKRDTSVIYEEKTAIHPLNYADIRNYDENLIHTKDRTKILGNLQGEDYIAHRKEEIRSWFSVKPEIDRRDYSSDDICIINFRGSGYTNHPDLFLPKHYWLNAMENMRNINPQFRFVVVTEDVTTARKFFPDLEVHHWSIGEDYAVVKNAKYLIIANSSFSWFPAWLSLDLKYCIAPKYWARHNVSDGYWSLGTNITDGWMYQDRKGNLSTAQECKDELSLYMKKNISLYKKKPQSTLFKRTRNFFRVFVALKKNSPILSVLARMGMISLMQITLRIKHTVMGTRKSQPTAKETPRVEHSKTESQKGTLSRLKDFVMIQGYY